MRHHSHLPTRSASLNLLRRNLSLRPCGRIVGKPQNQAAAYASKVLLAADLAKPGPGGKAKHCVFLAGADFKTGPATAGQTSGNARQDGTPAFQPVITTIKGETRVETGHL